jgi:branched-chain amino acid aminotransferase
MTDQPAPTNESESESQDQIASVFLDGEFMNREDARLSAFDAAIQHGVGLFETLSASSSVDGIVVHDLEAHLDRLQASAAKLGLSDDIKTGPLGEAIVETVRRARYKNTRVRLTLTGGDLNLLQTHGRSNHSPTVLIAAQPATEYPDEMFDKGVMVTLGSARVNPLDPTAGHKTLNYWWRLRELQDAASKGAGESIIFSVSNHLASGCVSNLFIVDGGHLITPIAQGEEEEVVGVETAQGVMPSPVLPGITRMRVIEHAKEMGIKTTKRMMTIDDLLDADEVFLTNSSWGVLPVVKVESEAIGSGGPGDVTKKLRAAVVG